MKILTLNCFGSPLSLNRKLRFREIASAIIKDNLDIVFLQEIIFSSDRKILEDQLQKMGYNFYPKENINFKNGGLVTLIKNIEVERFIFHKFKEQGPLSFLSLTDRVLGKGAQILTIKYKGKKVNLINTHLLCKYNGTEKDKLAYKKQIKELIEFVRESSNYPLILGGDVNSIPSSTEINELKTELNLIDLLSENDFTVYPENTNRGKFTNSFGDGKPFRTDYLLSSPKIKVLDIKVVYNLPVKAGGLKFHLSDHYGIMANIKLS